MRIVKYLVLLLFVFTISYADREQLDLKKDNIKYYYCAYTSYLKFIIENPIYSLDNFEKRRNYLNKLSPKSDANYYKIVSENNNTIYGYSIRTNELRELITLNEKGWIKSKKEFKEDLILKRVCKWKYKLEENRITIIKKCDDKSKHIKHYFNGDEKDEFIFKDNKLITVLIPDIKSNTIHMYDMSGTLVDLLYIIAEGDKCVPFNPYFIKTDKINKEDGVIK